ncbi:putative Down syndrome cell adhesion molecule-like [Apostichopus japonicus]|uniref:Putative Down syndrome cell adhesion molecule-like n=1 Tax=Stichopus japonicus TaxID=307972 RepID=A0A2G8JIR9_STIJA|nr:putative Down syndrome cell adhesion molecule-like [Apostichopus japonicus]
MASGSTGISVYWQQPPLESLNGVLQNFLVYYQPVRENEDENDVLVYSTEETNANIFNLQKFTNYSVSVAARTSVGEGIRSDAIYVRTEQDTPEAPADIKAYAASADPISIMVSWLPPLSANGILTKYRLTMQYVEGESPVTREMDLSPDTHYHLITDLKEDYNYDFWVQAATEIGLGVRSRTVTEVPEVPSKSTTISKYISLITCIALSSPLPTSASSPPSPSRPPLPLPIRPEKKNLLERTEGKEY